MSPTAPFMIRLPPEVKEALQAAALAERRSMSNLVLAVLGGWLEEHGHLKPEKPGGRGRPSKRGGRP